MTLIDSSQPAPDQPFDKRSGAAALPTDEDVLGPRPEKHEAAGAELPTDEDVLGPRPERQPERRPITGAVAPGPVGDWIFGNTQHSSLARIMDAFGATVDQDIGHYGEKLGLSEETSKALRDKGIFNDYAQGQRNIGKALNETLLRSGAVLVNGAIYGMPAVWHGLQEAVMEAGQQTEGTALEKGFGALGLGKPSQLAREVAAVPEAFPDFNFRMGMPHAPVPEPLRAARDLNVIGPGGEAAWKGVTSSDRDIAPGGTPLPEILVEETGGPTVPVEAAAADEASLAAAAAPDVHAIARSIAPETFTEFDTLEKRRNLFRKWIDDGGAQVPPNIAQNLKETEARLRELEPAVTAAYTKAKEGLPAITEDENAGGTEAANSAAGGAPEAQAAAAPAPAPEEGAVPAEGAPSPRVAGEAGAEATQRSIEDQRDHIVSEVKQSLIDAGRPSEEAQAAAQLVAARYEARAGRFKGALGTPQELFDRESSDIRKMERVAKSTKRLANPNSARALDDFQERMAQAKELRRKATEAGGSSAKVMSAEERFAGITEGEWKAQLEDSIEALEPEERQSVREDLSHLPAEDLQYLAERAEAGLPLFQIEAYHGSPHHFERFDISKIGTGEGAQAYGHGLYFAENEGVAKDYRNKLGGADRLFSGAKYDPNNPGHLIASAVDALPGRATPQNLKIVRDQMVRGAAREDRGAFSTPNPERAKIYRRAVEFLDSGKPLPEIIEQPKGSLYRVSLKPDKEDLLDWDKPLSEQSEKVKAALERFGYKHDKKQASAFDDALVAALHDEGPSTLPKQPRNPTGEDVYSNLPIPDRSKAAVSKALSEAGIPGIKYADAGSRRDPAPIKRDIDQVRESIALVEKQTDSPSQAERLANLRRDEASLAKEYEAAVNPTHNFVIFDDKDVEITHRNGEALSKQERADAVQELYQRPGSPDLSRIEELTKEARHWREVRGAAGSDREAFNRAHDRLMPIAEELGQLTGHPLGLDDPATATRFAGAATKFEPDKGILAAAVKEFGITSDPKQAGYILPDGRMLNFGEGGMRGHDHRAVSRVAGVEGDGTDAMVDFMNKTGAVRVDFNSGMFETHRIPTNQQMRSAIRAAKDSGVNLLAEASRPDGSPKASVDLDRPTIERLKAFYDEQASGRQFFQKALGSFLPDVANYPRQENRPTLKLSGKANASSIIHEWGHEWLEQMLRDDVHPLAPADLRADAAAIRKWLGIETHMDLNTGWPGERGIKARAAHEKFARGFEEYLFHGVAPSAQLARVFAKFKTWLTTIYQTLEKLRKQAQETGAKDFVGLNDDIRGVFDRMLAGEPQRVVAAAEREASPGLGERHEAIEAATPPERARDAANTIQSERDFHATQDMINSYHDRLADVEPGTGSRAERVAQPSGHGDEAGPEARSPGNDTEPGALGAGGGEAATAGHRAPPQPQPTVKTEPPPTGNAPFAPSAGKYTDKIGNFRIDGLNDPNQIFDALRENIEKTGGMVEQFRRGVTDGDLLNISLASGLKPEWLDSKKIGDAYSHREIKALEELFIAASTAVKDTALAAAAGEPTAILAQAEAMARMEMVQAHLAGASAEAGRALGAVRRVMKKAWGDGGRRTAAEAAASLDRVRQLSAQKWESPEALSAALKAETGRTLFQLQEMAEFAGKLDTPGRIARLVEDTSNGKMKQAVVFYYVNSLLSGPITHLRYAVGNEITALYSPLVRTPIAAGIDFASYHAGMQSERRVFLGEAGQELYALISGFPEAAAAGKEGWRIGTTPDLPGEGAPELFGAQPVMNPIPGKIGYAIGVPGKSVGMIHGFAAMQRYRQEINRLAYRTAMQEKLQGDAFTAKVADLSDRPPAENMEAAAKVSRSDLYMAPTDYNSISAGLARISDSSIIAKIILPFVKIGMQVESKAIANSPLALGALVPGVKSLLPHIGNAIRDDLNGVNGPEARTMRIASMVGGTGLMAATAAMVANGEMTGHGPHDKDKRDTWLALHKPYTVSIGPLTLNYNGWGYLGKLMAISANAYETHQGWGDEEGHSIASAYYQGFQEALFDDSFLRGVKDFLDAKNDPDRYGARYFANMLLNWTPASVGMGQVARLVDPYQRETHTSADTVLDTIFKEAWNKVPFASQWLYPKRDVFGQPIRNGGPNPNYTNDRTVKLLDSLHIGISDVHDQIRGVKLTDKQFDDYKVTAGVLTKSRLDDMMQTTGQHLAATGRPEDRAKLIEIVHKIVTRSREEAAKTVMMHAYGSDNDIVAKATEAKKVKKGLIPAPTVH